MPSINKTRVSNIFYDNNTRLYDDMIIPVHNGKLIIEAANGSGKTLLMQCILQAVKPKIYFHRKNGQKSTINFLIKSNSENKNIHSMIEWTLDEGTEHDYMITGFCAKPITKETENGTTTDIEYFNYAILYNADSPISVESIPLKRQKDNNKIERTTYSQLKKYLTDLSTREPSCIVRIFTSKREYEVFLNSYNINSSEYELMKLINSKEGGSEEYFTENYKTSYDFIVRELVERIESVDKMHLQDAFKSEKDLAKSLYEIKSTMYELQNKQSNLDEIDVAEEYFHRIIAINNNLVSELEKKELLFKEVAKGYNTQNEKIKEVSTELSVENKNKIEVANEKVAIDNEIKTNNTIINDLEEEIETLNKELDKVREFRSILEKRKEKADLLNENEKHEVAIKEIESKIEHIQKTVEVINANISETRKDKEIKEMENLYLDYLKDYERFLASKKTYEAQYEQIEEIVRKEKIYQGKLLYVLRVELNYINEEISKLRREIKENKKKLNDLNSLKQNKMLALDMNNNKIATNIESIENNIKLIAEKKESLSNNEHLLAEIEGEKDRIIKNIIGSFNKLEHERINRVKLETSILELGEHVKNLSKNDTIPETLKEIDIMFSNIDNYVQEYIKENNDRISELEEQDLDKELQNLNKPLEEQRYSLSEDKENISNDNKEINTSILNLNSVVSNAEDKLDIFYSEIEDLNELNKKYSIDNRFELEIFIKSKEDNLKNEIFKINEDIHEVSETIQEMEKNKGVAVSNDTKKCYEILSKAYSSATLGVNFNERLSIKEKEEILTRSTLIPVGIILNDVEFKSFKNNKNLLEKVSDFMTPIINIDKIKEGNKDESDIVYITSKDKEFYIDEDRRKRQIEELKNTLLKLKNKQTKLNSNLEDIIAELKRISSINHRYPMNFEAEQKTQIKDIKNEIRVLETEFKNNLDKLDAIGIDLQTVFAKIKANEEGINNRKLIIKRDIQRLNKEIITLNEFRLNINDINSLGLKLIHTHSAEVSTANAIVDLNSNILELSSKNEYLEKLNISHKDSNNKFKEEINNLIAQIDGIDTKIESLSSREKDALVNLKRIQEDLDDPNLISKDIDEITNNDTITSLKNDLKIADRNKNKKGGNITYVEEQMKYYEKDANDKLERIKTDIISIEELERKKNTLKRHEQSIFNSLNSRLTSLEEDLKDTYTKISEGENEIKSNKTLICTNNERIKSLDTREELFIDNNYNPDKEESLINFKKNEKRTQREETKAKNNELYLKVNALTDKFLAITNSIHKLETKFSSLNIEKDSILNTMNINNIEIQPGLGLYLNGSFSIKDYNKRIYRQSEVIDGVVNRHKGTRVECLEKLKDTSFDIIKILEQIEAKNKISSVIEQNNKIETECLNMLRITKETISKDLEQLNELKDSFIDKCLIKTENILAKIKKIQKLVTIEYNGKKIPLIKVNLNELDTETKKIKMRNHIEYTLGQIDTTLDTVEDSVQTEKISKALASSKLLEQVIFSPKRCEVQIFVPRDESDVTSNSRYVTWGGVASGGQRNVMYLTVSIALLLFIREISTDGTASRQTKVLYADGVFRSAASTYLWECIYPVLEDNNIQLITTNMGTPRALIKLFDSCVTLEVHQKQIGGNIVSENKIGHKSFFKSEERSLKSDNILHNFGEYRIPKKESQKPILDHSFEQISLL